MTEIDKRWELGSEFHSTSVESPPEPSLLPRPSVLFRSGRDALRSLLDHAGAAFGWKRILVPSYFCQEVVESLIGTSLTVALYDDGPLDEFTVPTSATQGDLLLVVNHFGVRRQPKYPDDLREVVTIIEDHTHDPWSAWARRSIADYILVSLRKTQPIPDGALLYSPKKNLLPRDPSGTAVAAAAALDKLSAMVLKGLYLEGGDIPKSRFRELATSGEARFASGGVSAASGYTKVLLQQLPIGAWRRQRWLNFQALSAPFKDDPRVKVLQPTQSDAVPFSCVLLFETAEQRDLIRRELLSRDIYPAVLWPLDEPLLPGIPDEHVAFSRRMLSIACDMRYREEDMSVVERRLREIL